MRAMGIIRRLDELGRVVIPVEMRRMLDLADRDMVEIAVDGDRIVLQKHTPRCVFCSRGDALVEYHNRRVCASCMRELSPWAAEQRSRGGARRTEPLRLPSRRAETEKKQ